MFDKNIYLAEDEEADGGLCEKDEEDSQKIPRASELVVLVLNFIFSFMWVTLHLLAKTKFILVTSDEPKREREREMS